MPNTLTDLKNTAVGGGSYKAQAAITASANGSGVDMQLSDGSIHAVVDVGVTDFSSGNETYVVALTESDTSGGAYTAIPSATVSVIATGTTVYISTGYRTKRWVRAELTIGGTTPSFFGSVVIVGIKKIAGAGSGVQL